MPGGIELQGLPSPSARRWLIAYSGGLDSSVLLHLACHYPGHPPLVAVHIHHGLQAAADQWQQHCAAQANTLAVPFETINVQVASGGNVEANARAARYAAFEQLLQPGDCLLMAHHLNDQLETFFYRLLRGAGVKGLSAIPAQRALGQGSIIRPLLAYTRQNLLDYAQRHQLHYVDDPSNTDERFDRNFLRQQLMPLLQQRWPSAAQSIHRSLAHLQEAQQLLDECAAEDLHTLAENRYGLPALSLEALAPLSWPRQKNALRYWLGQHDVALTAQQLQVLQDELIAARADATPELRLATSIIRRFEGFLYLCPLQAAPAFAAFSWHTAKPCHIAGIGRFALSEPRDVVLQVRQRQGGELIRLPGSTQRRKLKHLLQEKRVPPWLRDSLPLFFYQDELIAVGNLLVSASAQQIFDGAVINCYPDVPEHARI